MPRDDRCTPTINRQIAPCLECLSVSDLENVLLFLYGITVFFQIDPVSALQSSACFSCLSKKQLLQAEVSAMLDCWGDLFTVQEIINYMKCAKCASPRQRQSALAWIKCQFWQYWCWFWD